MSPLLGRDLAIVAGTSAAYAALDLSFLGGRLIYGVRTVWQQRGLVHVLVLLTAYLATVLGLSCLVRIPFLGPASLLVTSLALLVGRCQERIQGRPLDASQFWVLRYTSDPMWLSQLWSFHGATLRRQALFTLSAHTIPVGVALWVMPPLPPEFLLFPALGAVAALTVVYLSNGHWALYLPAPVHPLFEFLSFRLRIPRVMEQRASVAVAPRRAPLAPHLILVVDESVRGDLLGLNGGPEDTTPRLSARGSEVLSMGVATSTTNQTLWSVTSLLTGLRPTDLPDRSGRAWKTPLLFDYAAQVMERVQVACAYPWEYDFLDSEDLAVHSLSEENPGAPAHQLDRLCLDQVEDCVRQSSSSFTFLLKYGCHFDYENAYPIEERRFSPVPSGGDRSAAGVRNSYLNALTWSVDGFLDDLLTRLEGEDVAILYTSDHGIHFGGPLGRNSHGVSKGAAPEEGLVPLLLMGTTPQVREALASKVTGKRRARVSCFQVFASVLELLGFEGEDLDPPPEPSFLGHDGPEHHRFFSGDLAGRFPWAWNPVDPQAGELGVDDGG